MNASHPRDAWGRLKYRNAHKDKRLRKKQLHTESPETRVSYSLLLLSDWLLERECNIADCSGVPPDSLPPCRTSSFRIRCPSIIAVMESERSYWMELASDSACFNTKQPTDMAFLQPATNSEKMVAVTSHRSTYTDGLSLLAEGFGNWLGAPNYAWKRQKVSTRSRNFLKRLGRKK